MSEFRFGHPDQYEVGSIFDSRKALSDSRIHGPPMHGIWGRQREGACSIVMSGGYEDDIDELDYILTKEKTYDSSIETGHNLFFPKPFSSYS